MHEDESQEKRVKNHSCLEEEKLNSQKDSNLRKRVKRDRERDKRDPKHGLFHISQDQAREPTQHMH